MLKRKIAEKIIKFRIRSSRGDSLFGEIEGFFHGLTNLGWFAIIIERIIQEFVGKDFTIPFKWLIVIYPISKLIKYFAGKWDEKKGFWKMEMDYVPRHLNPWNKELMKRIKNIEHIVATKFNKKNGEEN